MKKEVVVLERGRKILLIVKFEGVKGTNVFAYDLQGKQYSLELDLAGFNSKTGKTYLDYYFHNQYLPTLEEYCKKNGFDYEEIKELKYKEMEEVINNKQNVLAVPKGGPYVVKKSDAKNLIQSATNRSKMEEIKECAEEFRKNNLSNIESEEINKKDIL